MKKIAVCLSGCGFMDGAEINESVLTLLAIENNGATYQCFAPDINQTKVVNHLTHEEMNEKRNVLVEAARIARGKIKDIKEAKVNDFDALIFPGGFGAAINLSNFASNGEELEINSDVQKFATEMISAKKPVGFICISPTMIPKLYPKGVKLTIGGDIDTAKKIENMGGQHIDCEVTNCVVDENYKVVSTPAYMCNCSISEAQKGINSLVNNVIKLM